MGSRLILMKSNVYVISWLHYFGPMLNCEKSDELMKSYPVRLFCVWCRR